MFGALLIALAASATAKNITFGTSFENVTLEAGRWVHLLCAAQGEEPITYRWYNQTGDEITTRDNKQLVYVTDWAKDSSLVFKNLSSENEGSYTCNAINAYGEASKVYFLTVPSPSAKNITFVTSFENVTLEAGRWVHLLCAAQGEEPITYRWYNQTGDEITTRDNKQLVYVTDWANDSSLVFKNLSSENEGSYTCNASNAHGEASKVYFLTVPSPSAKNITFVTPFENVTLKAGRWMHLLCKAQGETPITYRWYNQREDEITTRDKKQPVYVEDWPASSSLVFNNMSRENEGLYTCTANNTHGLARKVYFLMDPLPSAKNPTFKTPFENLTLEAGRWTHLLCAAQGEEPITYRWYNQTGDEVTTRDDKQLVYIRDWARDSSLVFKNLSSENEGWYTCTANNTYGQASKVYFLTVPPPRDGNNTGNDTGINAKVLKYTDKSVTFYITTSRPAQYIEAKYRESNGSSNATIKRFYTVTGNNSYKIGDLLPSGLYRFQFRTVPPESNKWSREYRVILLPDIPDIILESTCDRSVKLQLFARADNVSKGTIDTHQIKYFPVEMHGNSWTSMNCSVTTTTEVSTCVGSSYTILGLEQKMVYQIEVRAHTEAGYGQPWRQKVYVP